MTALRIIQVDAFATAPFTGNPAAVMPLSQWLDEGLMQAIAAENNLSETAFFTPADENSEADYELRWFTPALEVALCGHATLATGHHLLSENPALESVRFQTRNAGVLQVARAGEGYAMALPAYAPAPKPLPEAAVALGGNIIEAQFHKGRYSVFLYEHADEVRALSPNMRALADIGDWLFIATAPGDETDVISRVFVPGAGIDEDPVTGSAHAVLTPYWAERLGRNSFTAYQASARGGHIECRLDGDRAILGGRCTTVLDGQFFLP